MKPAMSDGAIGGNAKEHLRAFVERIERLEDEKKTLGADIKDVYTEAKLNGFDVKAMRAVIRLRKQDADERREQEAILETYMHALGMLADTPLGQSAISRAKVNSKRRLRESMTDSVAVAGEAARNGLISPEAAAETKAMAQQVVEKMT